jgi:hypothetical protein
MNPRDDCRTAAGTNTATDDCRTAAGTNTATDDCRTAAGLIIEAAILVMCRLPGRRR